MNFIRYELVTCEMDGKRVYFKGIKIDQKREMKLVTDSSSYEAKDYNTGHKTIDFTLTDPKDQRDIYDLYNLWEDHHQKFTIVIFSRNIHTNSLEPIVQLTGCVISKIDRSISINEEWKPSVQGMALRCEHFDYQFNAETGVSEYVVDAATKLDTISANTRGVVNYPALSHGASYDYSI